MKPVPNRPVGISAGFMGAVGDAGLFSALRAPDECDAAHLTLFPGGDRRRCNGIGGLIAAPQFV
jgi:hypothetical protein